VPRPWQGTGSQSVEEAERESKEVTMGLRVGGLWPRGDRVVDRFFSFFFEEPLIGSCGVFFFDTVIRSLFIR
jgi:hypothetical protein